MRAALFRGVIVAAGVALLCAAASAATGTAQVSASGAAPLQQSDWVSAPATQAQLDAGQVVVQSGFDARQGRVSVDAAIRVHAPPQAIWPLITRCDTASILIPGLRHCKELNRAPDDSWAVVEHDIKFAAMLPMVHSVFRADYHAPYRMDFHRIAGDMKDEAGSWLLEPSADGHSTTIEYRVAMQPGFFVPHGMVRRSLKKQLPAALLTLRQRAEHPPGSPASLASSNSSKDSAAPDSPPTAATEQ